ncbi:reticulocyte binding-like protein 2b [Aphelenchoides avenae]|nr:reticulocyte binding-like protein 2b [Aphelenchus avenae]
MSDCALEKHDTSNGCPSMTTSVTSHACGDNKAAEKNATIEDAPLLNGGSPQKRKNGLIAKSASPGSEDAKPNSLASSPLNNTDNLLHPKEEVEDCATPNSHNHSGLNGSADTKGFDDSCFKTPTLPVRKASIGRKRPSGFARSNGLPETLPSSDGVGEKDVITTGLRSVKLESEPSCSKTPCSCPFSKEYISACFPNLPEKSLRERDADFVQELIIDGHSLLMFKATDDLKLLMEKEKERKDAEAREAKRKQYYEDLRVGKVKKKGRKSKKEAEGNGDQEDSEERRRRREERRRERMERKARGDETPEEKERRREEKRRLKRERKAAECRADVARSSGTRMQSAKALQNGHDASSSNAAAMLVALSNGDHAAPSTVPVENNENQPTQLGSPAVVGIKRPGSVLGGSGSPAIAPSPKLQRISSSHSLERTSKPSTPKSEPSASVPFGMPIGIQRPNVPSLPPAYGQDQRAGSASEHAVAPSNPLASLASNYARSTSVIDKAGKQLPNGATNPAFMDFNAMFMNSPAFAANFRNAMATLQSVDPALVNQTQLLNAAALNARPFQHFDSQPQHQASSAIGSSVNGANAIGASPSMQPKMSVGGSSSAAASASNQMELQFPAGAALAAKLAGAAMFGKEPPGSSAAAPAKEFRGIEGTVGGRR